MDSKPKKPFQFGLSKIMMSIVPLAMYLGLMNWSHQDNDHMRQAVRWAESFGGSGSVADRGRVFEDHKIYLDLAGTKVSDRDMRTLKSQTELARLNLANTAITDEGLLLLYDARELEVLNLSGTQVTPAGIRSLREALPSLAVKK